jgi:uncharacterized damage-inducible protein DinB
MSLRQTLKHRLNDAWHGSPWYGDSSEKILTGITAEEAARRLAPGTHTIWEIVLHVTAWTEAVAARVRGLGSKAPDRGDWPKADVTTQDAWIAALADLETARLQLQADLDAAHEEDLHLHVKNFAAPFADTGITRAGTVVGLIEHDAYHLGQIALLKRALRAAP